MNPITKALDEVLFRIPREILNVVFINPYQQYRDMPSDLKERINFQVMTPRVLVDCNLVGGVEVRIPLDDVPSETVDGGYTTVFRIPKSKTNGRSISAAFDVTYGNLYNTQSGYGAHSYGRTSPVLSATASVMEAQLRTPYVGSARVELVGENVVMIQDSIILPQNLYLRCSLENDSTLSNIRVRSYPVFSRLVELAVKSYIYNNYIIKLDMGELRGGVQVGRFKEIVDSYADAETMYQEHLTEKWAKVAFMNDQESMHRFTSMLIGGSR
jgi:hypothetical protein